MMMTRVRSVLGHGVLALGLIAGFGGCSSESSDDDMDTAADQGGTSTEGGDTSTEGGETGGGGNDDSSDCPLGTFDCPCEDGTCQPGLECGPDQVCRLPGSGDGDGDPTTTGEPPTTEEGGDPTGEPVGGPYDPEACEDPAEVLDVELIDGQFCATPCTEDADCPDGPAGTTAACAISTTGGDPDFCTLMCTPGDDGCPDGASCQEIPQQPGFGLCTY